MFGERVKEMDEIDNEELLRQSEQIDNHDYRNPESEDDYLVMYLYKAPDGRHFRYIESSGFDSIHSGAANIVEWLDSAEVDNWKMI